MRQELAELSFEEKIRKAIEEGLKTEGNGVHKVRR
jgi:hypothetical protein